MSSKRSRSSSSSSPRGNKKTAAEDTSASSLPPPLTSAPPQRQLLELPTDLLRLILCSYCSPLSRISARFVCRRFRDLIPPPFTGVSGLGHLSNSKQLLPSCSNARLL